MAAVVMANFPHARSTCGRLIVDGLGSLMLRSGLVPRIIPTIGLVGAPVLLAATIATLFGQIEQSSAAAALAALPVAVWELSLGVYMVVKGFKPSPIIATSTPSAPVSRKVIVA